MTFDGVMVSLRKVDHIPQEPAPVPCQLSARYVEVNCFETFVMFLVSTQIAYSIGHLHTLVRLVSLTDKIFLQTVRRLSLVTLPSLYPYPRKWHSYSRFVFCILR